MSEWIKVNHSLVRSPRLRGLMRALGCRKHEALGVAVAWLCWVDEQTTEGRTGLLPVELDEELGVAGCADALVSIGWAAVGKDGCVEAVDFEKHNGDTAKERMQAARRQASKRARNAASRCERDECHGASVTNVTEVSRCERDKNVTEALPEKNRIYIDTEGVLSTTVDIEASAGPCAPPHEFGEWLKAVGSAVPMLRRLNLDKPLPRAVEAEARKAAELVPMTAEAVEWLRRYYAAEEVRGYRPDGLEWFFRDLHDVLRHAENWCKQDDRRRRKEAATARRKAQERVSEGERRDFTDEEQNAFFDGLRSDFRLER